MTATHRQLVDRAGNWLSISKGCSVVLLERSGSHTGEEPDAIGWKQGHESYLVEVKVSRADFLRDKDKTHRRSGNGLGCFRYYLCPPDLIKSEEVPDKWGLLYAKPHQIRNIKPPERFDREPRIFIGEMQMLTKAIRQILVGCLLHPLPITKKKDFIK